MIWHYLSFESWRFEFKISFFHLIVRFSSFVAGPWIIFCAATNAKLSAERRGDHACCKDRLKTLAWLLPGVFPSSSGGFGGRQRKKIQVAITKCHRVTSRAWGRVRGWLRHLGQIRNGMAIRNDGMQINLQSVSRYMNFNQKMQARGVVQKRKQKFARQGMQGVSKTILARTAKQCVSFWVKMASEFNFSHTIFETLPS